MTKRKKVLVTGALGMLGVDVTAALEAAGQFEVIPTDLHNLNITDVGAVRDILISESPDVVLHLAAFTDVDAAESRQLDCWLVNAEGTKNLAFFCRERGAELIYISTDYVFDGTSGEPYLEHDPPNPINFYGRSKLGGEEYAQALLEKVKIVRTSWLCGPGGSGRNFIETILQLAKRESELNVVTDQVGRPTFTFDLAQALVRLIGVPEYGIFHATNEGMCSWFDFAVEILRQAGVRNIPVKPILSDQLRNRPARRPAFSTLENTRFAKLGLALLPPWQKSLGRYLQLRQSQNKKSADSSASE
ncbi:MAG: dTDP-4-dehydrorhamnose reductase [Candidatus Sumerlaeia bacterium]